jgi:hypothetical protein
VRCGQIGIREADLLEGKAFTPSVSVLKCSCFNFLDYKIFFAFRYNVCLNVYQNLLTYKNQNEEYFVLFSSRESG